MDVWFGLLPLPPLKIETNGKCKSNLPFHTADCHDKWYTFLSYRWCYKSKTTFLPPKMKHKMNCQNFYAKETKTYGNSNFLYLEHKSMINWTIVLFYWDSKTWRYDAPYMQCFTGPWWLTCPSLCYPRPHNPLIPEMLVKSVYILAWWDLPRKNCCGQQLHHRLEGNYQAQNTSDRTLVCT